MLLLLVVIVIVVAWRYNNLFNMDDVGLRIATLLLLIIAVNVEIVMKLPVHISKSSHQKIRRELARTSLPVGDGSSLKSIFSFYSPLKPTLFVRRLHGGTYR